MARHGLASHPTIGDRERRRHGRTFWHAACTLFPTSVAHANVALRFWPPEECPMTIRNKLKLTNTLVLLLLVASLSVSIALNLRIQSDARQLSEVDQPLEQAILEMEINAGESARAVYQYLHTPDETSVELLRDSEADFERFALQFERLANTDEQRALGRIVMDRYREFKISGDKIISMTKQRFDDLALFRGDVETIDSLIDDELQQSIDRAGPQAITKLEAALDMEINIDEAFAAIEGYILESDQSLKRQIFDAEADFVRFEALYRTTALSEDEDKWLETIDTSFSQAVVLGEEIITLTDALNQELASFNGVLETMDGILDDNIQVLITEEVARAGKDAQDVGQIAIIVMLVMGLAVFATVAGVNWFVARSIVGNVTLLSGGAREFAVGHLDHRIDVQTKDELGDLADDFNQMADGRQRDETLLKQSEEKLHATLNSIGDAVIATDTEGKITLMNPVAEELTGWKLKEGDTRPLAEVFHIVNANTGEPAFDPVAAVLESGKIVGLANHTMLIARDGTKYQIADAAAPIRDLAGKTSGVVLVFRDVTADYAAHKALEDSEERLRSAFNHVPVGNIVIDQSGSLMSYNKAAHDIFGYEEGEVIGRNVKMLMPEADASKHDTYLQKYLDTGDPKIIGSGREVMGLRKNGETFPMHLGVGEMIIGDTRSFIGSIADLTDIKSLEQQLLQSQRMEAIGQLTGGIAHDFNNLLGIMIGNTELLETSIGGNEQAQAELKVIEDAVDRATSLTNRLLAFARQQTLSPVATDVNDMIEGLETMLRRTLGETIDMRIDPEADLWLATIDPHQFEGAMVNLSLNARDAMPGGGILTIETTNASLDATYAEQHEEVSPGDYVLVSVSDTGIGMTDDILAKVFEPFFTTKEVGQGSGLGLSMVFGFVKQSAGHITAYSEAGRGTTVKLYLPRSQATEIRDAPEQVKREFEQRNERILIVEDDEELRKIPVRILGNQGYDIFEAKDGEEAISHLENGPPFDLLFTDIVLPGGMNGIDIAERAKALQPKIKILFTTGYAENATKHNGQLAPEGMLVNKPYRKVELLEKVSTLLDSVDV